MTSPPLPLATSTQTITPSPHMLRLPLALDRAARTKGKLAKCPPPSRLRVRSPLLLKRGLPASQVLNVAFLLLVSPPPHTQTPPSIAGTFPDIAARVLRKSNCLLPLGFSATVNLRGVISLTVTDKATPASSYAPYFDSLTRALNQSFPVGENPWCTLVLAPTAVQLAIHSLPLRFLRQDEGELFPYIRQTILNDKATPVLSARYHNPDRDSRSCKQATSVVITVDPQHVSTLTSGVFILLQKRKVELAFSASRTSQFRNCWRYGQADQ